MSRWVWAVAYAAFLAAACSTPGSLATSPGPSATASVAATPTPTVPPGCTTGFLVTSGRITVRINEEIGPFPVHEAVLVGARLRGGFALTPAGFASCSAVVADLRDLQSTDQVPGELMARRDEIIHLDLLDTQQYPDAVLEMRAAPGLPNPLPARGRWTFALAGRLTMHGESKDLTWQVVAERVDAIIEATATTEFTFSDFRIERPNNVLGLGERIRAQVEVKAEAVP